MIHFEVRFKYYKYNTGRADNGTFIHKYPCKTLEQAEKWIKEALPKNTKWFWEQFYIDGYLESIVGIYEITERKVG